MHIRRKYTMPNTIEVQEFNSWKCPGGGKRQPKSKPTPERMKRNNQKRKERECSRMVETYFNDSDLLLTLTYKEDKRPEGMEACKDDFRDLCKYLRREYGKRMYELFWIRNIEVGPSGAWHIHMLVNRIDGAELMITDWWTARHGSVLVQYLKNMTAEGGDIGAYMAKTAFSTSDEQIEEDEEKAGEKIDRRKNNRHRVVETSWSHSRNVKKVLPEDKEITGRTMHQEPRVPKGWYLDKNSVYEGTTPDGYPYRTYTFRRIEKREICHKMRPSKLRTMQKRARKGRTCGKRLKRR